MNAHANVNDAMIMIGTHSFGLEPYRVPLVARCISAADKRGPAVRRTVPRAANETEQQFWQRVVDTVRELKAGRPWDWTVSIFFDYENHRSAADWFMQDAKFNMHQIDVHLAYHGTSARRRVAALCKLYDSTAAH